MIRIYAAENYDEMSEKAARIIAAQVIVKPECVLGLATGSSPIGTYKGLVERYNCLLYTSGQVGVLRRRQGDETGGLEPHQRRSAVVDNGAFKLGRSHKSTS